MKQRTEFGTENQYREYLKMYYAGLAMQGLMSRKIPPNWKDQGIKKSWVEWVAELSCEMADELIVNLLK